MTIVLPNVAALAKASINAAELLTTPTSTLASVAAEQGGEVVLVGRLEWDEFGARMGHRVADGLAWPDAPMAGFAALRLMKPSDAASAARPKSSQATAIQDRRTDLRG